MKDATKMKGPIVGHYGEYVKVTYGQEILFPDFRLMYTGPKEESGPEAGEKTTYYYFDDGRAEHLVLALSKYSGIGKPLEFEFYEKQMSVEALEPEPSGEIAIKIEMK